MTLSKLCAPLAACLRWRNAASRDRPAAAQDSSGAESQAGPAPPAPANHAIRGRLYAAVRAGARARPAAPIQRTGASETERFLREFESFLRETPVFEHFKLLAQRPLKQMNRRASEPSELEFMNPGRCAFRFAIPSEGRHVMLEPLREVPNGPETAAAPAGSSRRPSRDPEIEAYWLPWKPGAATALTLGDGADYFFTSQLGGCRIQVDMTDPRAPTVVHVAGAFGPLHAFGSGRLYPDSAWKDEQAMAVLGEQRFAGSHRMSFTQGEPDDRYQGEGLNVIGRRDRQNGQWEFWVQQPDLEENVVSRCYKWLPKGPPGESGRAA